MNGKRNTKGTWDTLMVLASKGKYWPTSVKARELKRLPGSQMGRSINEVRYDGRESVGLIAMKPLTYV